jgi:hypothetical protein
MPLPPSPPATHASADTAVFRQLLIAFSERLSALSQPAVAERGRSLPLLLTHLLLHIHVLPYIRLRSDVCDPRYHRGLISTQERSRGELRRR